MTIVLPVNIGTLGIFVFIYLYFVGLYPKYTIVGGFASITMTASQTITNSWFPILCQDVNTARCYYLTTGNQAVQIISIAGLVVVAVKVLLAILRT